jgi:hypothetical protein
MQFESAMQLLGIGYGQGDEGQLLRSMLSIFLRRTESVLSK